MRVDIKSDIFANQNNIMGTKEKLIQRFLSSPKDFTYEEVLRLFGIFGYSESNKGATSGSRVEFVSEDGQSSYIMHKPHPGNIIKSYVMKQLHAFVDNNKLVEKFNINNTQKKGK